MDVDDDSEIYEMDEEECEEEDYEVIPGTSEPKFSDEMDSFYLDEEGEGDSSAIDLVHENPFEPVYPAASAGLLFDENSSDSSNEHQHHQEQSIEGKGMVLEAISLDNILPVGSRRRHRN